MVPEKFTRHSSITARALLSAADATAYVTCSGEPSRGWATRNIQPSAMIASWGDGRKSASKNSPAAPVVDVKGRHPSPYSIPRFLSPSISRRMPAKERAFVHGPQ